MRSFLYVVLAAATLVEKGPDSLADIDAKLKQLAGAPIDLASQIFTKSELAKLKADKADAAPSSLIEKGSPDSFADLDAKLKQLEEKTKSELAKLKADAAPSSFIEKGSPDSFADLDAKLKQLEEKTKSELAKLKADAAPSSFIEKGSPTLAGFFALSARGLEEKHVMQQEDVQWADKTKAELAKIKAGAVPSSFIEKGSPDSFADLDAKLKQLEEKTKSELAKLKADAAPSSFIEKGSPDSFADLDSKLKQLEQKTKSELAKLNADAAPSSLLEKDSPAQEQYDVTQNKLSDVQKKLRKELDALKQEVHGQVGPSSFLETDFSTSDGLIAKLDENTAKTQAFAQQVGSAPLSLSQYESFAEENANEWSQTQKSLSNERDQAKAMIERAAQEGNAASFLQEGGHAPRSFEQIEASLLKLEKTAKAEKGHLFGNLRSD